MRRNGYGGVMFLGLLMMGGPVPAGDRPLGRTHLALITEFHSFPPLILRLGAPFQACSPLQPPGRPTATATP